MTPARHDRNSLKLSVIVPVKNGHVYLPRCLEAILASDYPDFEVIVVDDGSTDDTPQIAEAHGARVIRLPASIGPGGARNRGVAVAKGEILVFVDADVVVPPGALSLIADDFARDPELSALFGSYDDEPAWPSFLSQYKNLMHHYVHQVSSEEAVTFWAGCGAMRKTVFEEFGGFDASEYPEPSIEDIALGHKLHFAGRKIRLDKRLQAKHLKRWTISNLLRADILCRAVPWTRLILESKQMPRDLNLTYASKLSAVLVCALLVVCGLGGLWVAGLHWIPLSLILASGLVIAAILILLNWKVYKFFYRKRGLWFAVRVIPLHWLYYLYSGGTFAVCTAMHFAGRPFAVPF